MKIEQLIVQYLYNHKVVSLQNIGTFTLSTDVVPPEDDHKEVHLPDNAVQFTYNPHAEHDDGLIDFIVEITRKIRPLATSDLESFTLLSREYLNIGKPYIIEGLGAIHKNQNGVFEFTQGHVVNPKLVIEKEIKDNVISDISFASPVRKKLNKKGWIIGISALLLTLLIPASIYYLAKERKIKEQAGAPVKVKDTTSKIKSVAPDSSLNIPPLATTILPDTAYTVAVKRYFTEAVANSKMKEFNSYGHHFQLRTIDSATYYLTLRISGNRSDSTRVTDSLNRLFGVKSFLLNP